jgi:hypothetical protein
MPTTFTIDENTPIIVEFPTKPGVQQVGRLSPEMIAEKSAEALDKTMHIIHTMARRVTATIDAISVPPKQAEVEFGIIFDSEAGAVLAKAGVECSINVKLTWERKEA